MDFEAIANNYMNFCLEAIDVVHEGYREYVLNRHGKRWHCKPIRLPRVRRAFGAYATVFTYFQLNDDEEFYKFTRMTVPQFNRLSRLVRQKLRKTSNRESLPPDFRLVAVLK